MLCYVDINLVLCYLLQDTLLLKSAKEGDFEGIRKSLSNKANINISNKVYAVIVSYLYPNT